jgi:cytochrome P450
LSVFVDLFSVVIQRHPVLLREVLALVRRRKPRLAVGNTVAVLDAAGVREVLGRPSDFLSGMDYAQKLKLGPLVLGLDESERQALERSAMERFVGEVRVEEFEAIVQRNAEQVLSRGRPNDFVSDLVEPVLAAGLCELFGVDVTPARSRYVQAEPGLRTFVQWLRKLGGTIAAAVPAPFGLEAVGEAIAGEMFQFLEAQVRSSEAPVLQRMAADLGVESVARCVGGNLLASATLLKSSTLALSQLLSLQQLEPAMQALAGKSSAEAHGLALAYVREALRFAPPFAFLARHCPRPAAIGDVQVPAGATVVISLLAAMFDPNAVVDPERFSTQRPLEAYVPFGVGLHECVGKGVSEVGWSVLFTVFLNWLRDQQLVVRAPGPIRLDGPAVASYPLVYRQGAAHPRGALDATVRADDRSPLSARAAAAPGVLGELQ